MKYRIFTGIINSFLVAFLLLSISGISSKKVFSQVCSTPGIDGPTVSSPPINTYYPPSGNVVLGSGSNSVELGSVPGTDPFGNSYGNIEINPGDLLLIIQVQGADINTSNNANYGSGSSGSGPDGLGGTGFSSLNNVGVYEYIVANNSVPLSGGVLEFRGAGSGDGLVHDYMNMNATATSGQSRFQVVRVPQFSTLSLNTNVSCPAWNGRVGGIIALDAAGAIHMNGYTINASGAGFRAGYQDRENSDDNRSLFRTTSISQASGKGEGIAGTPRWMFDGQNQVDQGSTWIGYPQGDYGRGAPGNAGGGGNDHNAGGGGGGNAGAGGVGGNGWQGAGGAAIPHGGRPGINLPQSLDRIFLGGGGGGGDANNATTGVKGGPGGGAIFITADLITGSGSFISNGDNGQVGAYGSAPDGAGGGGAGGSVFIKTKSSSPSANLTIIANGGNGGNTLNDDGSSHTEHGPGGGGGGGTVFHSVPGASISTQVNAGNNGLTDGGDGNAHGSEDGQDGYVSSFSISQLPGYLEGFSALCIPELIVDVAHTGTNPVSGGTSTTYQITVQNISGGAAGGTLIESQLPTGFSLVSASVFYAGNATGPSSLTNIGTTNQPAFDAFNIPQNGIVTIDLVVSVDASVATGTYHTGAQAHFLDPTRDSSDPNRFITAETNALPGSNTTYQSSGLPVDGSNYDGSPSGPTDDDVIIHAQIFANDDDNIGNPVNGFFGGVAISNVLDNDQFLGAQATVSDVEISVVNPSSNTNIQLNTTTGEVNVDPFTPGGTYSIEYAICEIGNIGNCDQAMITVEVLHTASVSVEKTADLTEVVAGKNITYTITVNNPGPSDAQSVLVSDNLPPELTFVSASTTAGSFTAPDWELGTLAAGTTESIEITATVNADVPSGTQVSNTAVVSGPTPDPDPDDNTSTTTTNVIASADLSITKTAQPNPFVAGENITYTITVSNNGPSDAQNVSVADNLPAGLVFTGASATDGTWGAPNWTIGTLAAGGSSTLTLEASVLPGVAQSSTIENTATVGSDTPDPNTTNNTATHTGDVNAVADLNINKTALTTAVAGDTVTYSIEVENAGPSDAQGVELNDVVPASILSPGFSTDGGNSWSSWPDTYTYGELTDGAGFSIMLRGIIDEGVAEGSILSNTATAESSTTDPNPSNNSDTETLTVTTLSDVSVEKTGPATIIAGTKITYGLTVLNNGPSDAVNLEIEDILPAGVTNGEYSLNNGNSWQTWGGLRTLPVFIATPGVNNILIRGDVSASATGSLVNVATVSSDTPDPDTDNNESDVTTTIETSADLILTKTALTSPVNKNEEVVYQISVFNDGPSDATNMVITDVIDPAIISVAEYSTDNGSTWNSWSDNINAGTLNTDGTYSLRIRGVVSNTASSPLENTASVTSDVNDPEPGNNTQTIETPLETEADLEIVKTAPGTITAGTQITYTIEVSNLSPNMNAESVTITDNFDENIIGSPEYSDDGGSTWSAWSNWINIGTLNYGDAYAIQIRGDVLSNITQDVSNTATVSSSTPDPDNSNNSSTVVSTTNRIADVEVRKELVTDAADFVAGSEIVYRLTYINNGPSDATNYMVYDDVPSMIENVEASRCESGFVPWNGSANMGTVVSGGECTVLIKGTISSDFEGDITNTATVSSELDDPDSSNNTSTISNNVNTYADLYVSKTSVQEDAVAGEVINYTITVNNFGLSDAQNVVLTDNLPAELELISANTSVGTWNSPEWNIGTMANGAEVTMEITALVKADVPQGATITNTASVTSTTPDPDTSNNTSGESNQVNALADLEISKVSQTNTVIAGQNISYSITVSNNGSSDAQNVSVTDNLPAGLTFVSASPSTGNFAGSEWEIGTLSAGASSTLELTALVNADVSEGTVINNTAIVSSPTTDPEPDNNTSTSTKTVNTLADLVINKTASDNNLNAGEEIVYTLSVENIGPSDAVNVNVNDVVPSTLSITGVSTNVGNWISPDWNIGTLPIGQTVQLTITANVNSNVASGSSINNTANVSSTTPDPVSSNNSSTHTANISTSSDLTLSKVADKAEVVAGESLVYTITATNNGPSDALDVLVSDNLPSELTLTSANTTVGTFSNPDWNIGMLEPGETATLTLNTMVADDAPHGTNIGNSVIVSTPVPDPDPDNDTSSVIVPVVAQADLAVVKSASPNPFVAGEDITYSITVTNNGPSVAQNVSVNDVLPSDLIFTDASTTDGTWADPEWNIGNMPVNSSQTLTINASVNPKVLQGAVIQNTATVNTDTDDPVSTNNTSTHNGNVAAIADLALSKEAITAAVAGDTLIYQISVENAGPSDAQFVQVSDDVASSFETPEYSTDNGESWNVWTGILTYGLVDNGASFDFLLRGDLNEDIDQGVELDNTATVLSTTSDPETSNNSDTETIAVTTLSDLSIEKTGPATIVAGTKISYSLTVLNNGPSNAVNTRIEDILPAGVTNGEYSLNEGNSWQSWSGLRTLSDFIVYPGTNYILIRGDISPSASGSLVNVATVSSDTPDPDTDNNESEVTTIIEASADLVLTKTSLTSPVNKNEEVVYQISVFNHGPSDATNTVITDVIDPAIISGAEYSLDEGSSWNSWTGSVNVGDIAIHDTYEMRIRGVVSNAAESPLENTASVASGVSDPEPENNTQTIQTPLETEADLEVVKTAPENITAGTQITYTIEVSNLSPNMNAESVLISDNIDDNFIANPEYSVDGGANWLAWNGSINIGTLNFGDTYGLQIRGDVLSNVTQNVSNTVTVNSGTSDPDNSNNTSTAISAIQREADVVVLKELVTEPKQLVAGGEIVYLITYSNNGPSDATNYMVYDDVPEFISEVDASRCKSAFFTWKDSVNMGTVVAGGECTVLIRGTLNSAYSGVIENTATVSSEVSDPVLSNNTSQTTDDVYTVADLAVVKTAIPEVFIAGETVTYSIILKNNGFSDAQDVMVTDNLPSNLDFISATPSSGTWSAPEWNVGTMINGATDTLQIEAKVKPDVLQGTSISNTAFVSSTTHDSITDNNSSTIINSVDALANVSVIKTADLTEAVAGENITYTVTVNNPGPSDAQSVLVSDNLPPELTFVSASATAGIFTAPNWELGTLAAGTSETIEITATVNADVPSGTQVSNTAVVSGPTPDPDPDDNTSTTTTNVIASADLSITKTAQPNPFVAGENITYTITVSNNGPSGAQNVSVEDMLPAELVFTNATTNNGTWSAPNWSIGTIAAGSISTLTIEASVLPGVAQSSTIENTATVTSDTTDPDGGNNTATHTGDVNAEADLNINKTALTTAVAGDTVTYSIEVENAGPSDAQGVELDDVVPASILSPGFSTDGGNSWSSWPDTYTYGELADGAGFSIMLRGIIDEGVTEGSILSNTATAESSTTDPNPSNNSDTETLTVTTLSDVSVEKTGPATIVAGTKITYGLTVLNNGPSDAVNLEVEDILPAGVTNGEYSLNNGNSWQTWGGLRTLPVFIATPGVNNILIRGDVSASATGSLVNVAMVSSDTPDPDTGNNESDVTTTIETSADLVLTKTALTSPVNKNEEIVYQISVFNDGPSDATNAEISDVIDPSIISGAEYSTDNGSSWSSWSGSLIVGTISHDASYDLLIRGTVTNDATDPLLNTASVSSEVPDPEPGNNTHTIETPLEVEADLEIVKTAPETITAGTQITYTIEVSNLSPNMNATSVVVADNINSTVISNPEYSVDGGMNWNTWEGSQNIGTLNFGDSYSLQIRGDVQSNASGNIDNTATVRSNTPDSDNSNNTSTVSTAVNKVADVEVIKELVESQSNLNAGSEIVYRLTYINNGPSDATNYMVYDEVPSMIENVEASRCESGFVPWNGSANMGTVVAGGECTVLIKGTISSDFEGSITNTATVSSELDDPDLDNNTSTVTHDILSYADLRITKQASKNQVIAGNTFTYMIKVTNKGVSDAHDVVVTDVFPTQLVILGVNEQKGTWAEPDWNIGTLTKGSTVSMEITARAKKNIPQGTTITNTATVTSSTSDPVSSNNSDTHSVLVNAVSDLEISKTVNSNKVIAGETLTYRIEVQNNGPSGALGVCVDDYLPSGLFVENVSTSEGNWDAPVWNIGDLDVNDSKWMEITARVDPGMPDGSVVSNTATIHSSTSDPEEENDTSTVKTLVGTGYDLELIKTASVGSVVAGETFTYTVHVDNNGPSHATNFQISDSLPEHLVFVNGTGGAMFANGIVTWNIDKLNADAQLARKFTVRVEPDTPGGTNLRNVAVGITEKGDTTESNTNVVTVISDSDFSVVKRADKQLVKVNDTVTYEFTVRNLGEQVAENAVLTDTLSSDLIFINATGNYTVSGRVITWQLGDISHNEMLNLSFTVKVKPETPGGTIIPNTAYASSTNIDENVKSNTELITVKAWSEFSVIKTAHSDTVNAGESINYTIKITNNGPSVSNNIQITDELPAGLTFVSASNDGGLKDNTVSWTIPTLAAGKSDSVTMFVKTDPALPHGTVVYNTAIVQSDETEEPEHSEEEVIIDNDYELNVEKIAQSGTVYPGGSVTYFIDVSNNGPSNAHNIQVVDELPGELSFVNADNGGYYSDGQVFWDIDSVVANTTLRLSVEMLVGNDVEQETEIRNIALAFKPDDDDPEETDTSIVVVGYDYDLLITKTSSDTAVFAGDEIDYNISLYNNGEMDLYDLFVADTLQGNVEFVSASHDALHTDGIINWNIPEIKAGEQIELLTTVKVEEETEAGTLIYNVAWLSDNYTDNPNSSDTTTVEVISEKEDSEPGLFVSKTTTSSLAHIGDTIEYAIEVSNTGTGMAHNVSIHDNLPDELTFVSATDGGQLIDGYLVEWLIGNLDEGQSKVVQISALLNENAEEGSVVANYAVTSGENRDTIVVDGPSVIDVAESVDIVANDDYSHIDYFFEGTAIFNILENDSVNGNVATLTDVEISIVDESRNPKISLGENTGEVNVSGTVPIGTYQITYRICEGVNPDNCDDAVITIEITDNCEMIIPDGFSPNGDGVGDYFRITCIDRYPDAKIEIFNRWGNVVYSKENYGNVEIWGDQDAWWNGYSQHSFDLSNNLLPVGTYFYILRLDDTQEAKTGSIFLNR